MIVIQITWKQNGVLRATYIRKELKPKAVFVAQWLGDEGNPYPCISKLFCEGKKLEFHQNESSMSSWKPGELIRLFIYLFIKE